VATEVEDGIAFVGYDIGAAEAGGLRHCGGFGVMGDREVGGIEGQDAGRGGLVDGESFIVVLKGKLRWFYMGQRVPIFSRGFT